MNGALSGPHSAIWSTDNCISDLSAYWLCGVNFGPSNLYPTTKVVPPFDNAIVIPAGGTITPPLPAPLVPECHAGEGLLRSVFILKKPDQGIAVGSYALGLNLCATRVHILVIGSLLKISTYGNSSLPLGSQISAPIVSPVQATAAVNPSADNATVRPAYPNLVCILAP